MTAPYYADEFVTLWHGDCREVLGGEAIFADLCVTDPPYGDTPLEWDEWPEGWVDTVEGCLPADASLWCFGSMRMHMKHRSDFDRWKYAQEIIWQKHHGSGFGTDRFIRVHEIAMQYYRGQWTNLTRDVPREVSTQPARGSVSKSHTPSETRGDIVRNGWVDDGTRMLQSVLKVRNMHRLGLHPTEKPLGILSPLVAYSSKVGDTILDPFAGSGSTLHAAKLAGRRAVGIEANEKYCGLAAARLSQGVLDFGEVS